MSRGRVRVTLAARRDGRPDPSRPALAIVVDVLRATSTLTVALRNGARGVLAFRDPAAALAHRASHPDVLACGERDGRPVPGFDLGNSPFEFDRDRVAGKTLAFASTNGSFAIDEAATAGRRIAGAFVNAGAVLAIAVQAADVRIVCAGKEGRFALEDAAFAGWCVRGLASRGFVPDGASARLAASLAPGDAAAVRSLVEGSAHGRYLAGLGDEFARDVAFCGTLDAIDEAFAL